MEYLKFEAVGTIVYVGKVYENKLGVMSLSCILKCENASINICINNKEQMKLAKDSDKSKLYKIKGSVGGYDVKKTYFNVETFKYHGSFEKVFKSKKEERYIDDNDIDEEHLGLARGDN